MLKRLEELKQQQKQLEEIITIKENLLKNFEELANTEILNLIKKISGYEYITANYEVKSVITDNILEDNWKRSYDWLSINVYIDDTFNWRGSVDFVVYIYKDEVEVSSGMVCRNYSDDDVYFKALKIIVSILENKNLILNFANNKLIEHRIFIKEFCSLDNEISKIDREISKIERSIEENVVMENLKIGQRYTYSNNAIARKLTGNYFIVQKITNKTVVILPQENNSIYNSYYDNKTIKKDDFINYVINEEIKLIEVEE